MRGRDCVCFVVSQRYTKSICVFFFFFFNDTATTEIYTLSLHDALPICFKYSTIEDHLKRTYEGIKGYLPEYQVMTSSRTPSYIALTGHSLPRRDSYTDFQLPKLYLWSGNQPGFRYTVNNYVDTLSDWNPSLSKKNVVALAERILGIEFPKDYPVEKFNDPAPRSFYNQIAGDEMKKMIHLGKDPDKLIPFIADRKSTRLNSSHW